MKVVKLSEIDFGRCREQWDETLALANEDQVFNSWAWLYSWWETYGQRIRADLSLYIAENEAGSWLAIAPFCVTKTSYFGSVRQRLLQQLGVSHGGPDTVLSEFVDIIVRLDIDNPEQVRERLLHCVLESSDWDEIRWGYLMETSHSVSALEHCEKKVSASFFCEHHRYAYDIDLANGPGAYRDRLSVSARRAMFNKRRRMHNLRSSSKSLDDPVELEQRLELINDFHEKRFGQRSLERSGIEFFCRYLSRLNKCTQLMATEIYAESELLSVSIDIVRLPDVYNLLLGFREGVAGQSLGLLHIGVATEEFASIGATRYRLLADGGKHNSTYKGPYASQILQLTSCRGFNSTIMATSYGFLRQLSAWWRQTRRALR